MPSDEIMDDFKEKKLHSGSSDGPIVKSKKQAKAILMSYLKKEGKVKAAPKLGPRKTA